MFPKETETFLLNVSRPQALFVSTGRKMEVSPDKSFAWSAYLYYKYFILPFSPKGLLIFHIMAPEAMS